MADIIQIQQEGNGKLSKKQAEFNQLNTQIKNLSDTIDSLQKELPQFYERISKEVDPLTEKIVSLRKETIRMGEQMLSNHFTKKKEREILIDILLDLMDSLPYRDEEVIELYNKVTNGNYEEDVKNAQMAEFLNTKKKFENMSGEKLDPEIDTLEKLVEHMKQRAAQMYEEQEELRRRIAEKKAASQRNPAPNRPPGRTSADCGGKKSPKRGRRTDGRQIGAGIVHGIGQNISPRSGTG